MNDLVTINKIGLAKLFLWMEAERLESYPEAFARLQENIPYTKESLAKDTFGLIPLDSNPGKTVRGDFLNNFYGLERTGEVKVLIRGINALCEIQPGVFQATENALKIGKAYRDKDQTTWLREMARIVARFEVRTRLMLHLLGKGGYTLSFPSDNFFGYGSSRAELNRSSKHIALFAEDARSFNELLQEYRWIALGPWWVEEIRGKGLEIAHDFVFEGIREPKPPTNKLSGRLKNSMFLMKYLDILVSRGGEWAIDAIQASAILGEEVAQDFVTQEFVHSPIEHLQQWKVTLQDELGFVIVSDLVQRWSEYKELPILQAEAEFDAWLRQQIYHGRVHVLETHAGQPRLGRGLYGDETARKIRFEIIEA